MATITVQMLGGFEIRVGKKPVLTSLNTTRKAVAVLQYLLLQKGEKVSHQMLIDAIWRHERTDNPDMALRALLHRIRNAVKAEGEPTLKDCIVTGRGYYQWNPALDCETDVEEMLTCSAAAATARSAAQRNKLYARIIAIYQGRLLPDQSGEAWVEGRSVRLHAIYRNALHQQLGMMKQQGWNEQIVALCRRAIELDIYEESLYLEQIMALEALDRKAEAQDVARAGTALGCLHRELAPHLLPTTYTKSRRGDTDTQTELTHIAAELEKNCANGAQLCSYITFCELYTLQRGLQQRHGLPLLLGLIALTPSASTAPGEQENAMQELAKLIRTQLRQSDVAAQYGTNRYVILFSGGIGKEKTAPLERLKIAFYQSPVSSNFLMHYSINTPAFPGGEGSIWADRETAPVKQAGGPVARRKKAEEK